MPANIYWGVRTKEVRKKGEPGRGGGETRGTSQAGHCLVPAAGWLSLMMRLQRLSELLT